MILRNIEKYVYKIKYLFIFYWIIIMEQKTLKKDFILIDDENFNVVETRETTTPVNHKRISIELKTFRSNLKGDMTTIMKNQNAVRVGCERFNSVIDDLETANKELKIEMAIPERIDYALLEKEIIDEENSIREQQEKALEEQKAAAETPVVPEVIEEVQPQA